MRIRDQIVDYDKMFVVLVWDEYRDGYGDEVDVRSYDSFEEAIDELEIGGYFREDSHFYATIIDNRKP